MPNSAHFRSRYNNKKAESANKAVYEDYERVGCVELDPGYTHQRAGDVTEPRRVYDAINLRYYRELRGLAQICACGQKLYITHALNCKKRGLCSHVARQE